MGLRSETCDSPWEEYLCETLFLIGVFVFDCVGWLIIAQQK